MPEITYYALISENHPRERPEGLVRRIHTEPMPTDQELRGVPPSRRRSTAVERQVNVSAWRPWAAGAQRSTAVATLAGLVVRASQPPGRLAVVAALSLAEGPGSNTRRSSPMGEGLLPRRPHYSGS
jgi:hypothetical protein